MIEQTIPETMRSGQPPWKLLIPAAVCVGFHAVLLASYVGAFHGDVSALVCTRADWVDRPPFDAVHTGFPTPGYDGEFYFLIAQHPWQKQVEWIDAPAYRHQRILYPALAWVVSGGGEPERLVWALPAINLAAIGVLAWIGALFAERFGMSVWWGCLLPLAVSAGLPALRDLTDSLAICAACGLLAAWVLNWGRPWLILWAAAAVLAREQNIAVVAVVLAATLWRKQYVAASGLGMVFAGWVGWMCLLHHTYGSWPFHQADSHVLGALPLAGMRYRWTHLHLSRSLFSGGIYALSMPLMLAQCGLATYLAFGKSSRVVALVTLLGVALALFAGKAIYEDFWSYMRVFVWIPAGLWLTLVQTRRRWAMAVLLPAVFWPWVAVAQVWVT
jgi:hypothetical protein